MRHLKIEVALDFAHRSVDGVCTLTLAPLQDGPARVVLQAAEMTVSPRRFRSELFYAVEKKLRENHIEIIVARPNGERVTFARRGKSPATVGPSQETTTRFPAPTHDYHPPHRPPWDARIRIGESFDKAFWRRSRASS